MKTAILFPGQGSQAAGMGRDFFDSYPEAREIFEQADAALGFPLSELCFEGPQEDLNLTANTQPSLLTVSAAMATVFRNKINLDVAFTAGHSLGEYTALWFAGSIPFEAAVKLVRTRGKAMQIATPKGVGSMAAIMGLSSENIEEICHNAANGQILEAANFNGPGQIVISGHREAVERAVEIAKEMGAKRSVLLPVSAPFHCALMEPAAVRMASVLADAPVSKPIIPVVNNVDATSISADPDAIRDSLVRQVTGSVKWEQSIKYMVDQGVSIFIEIGAGRVLTNLVKRINPASERYTVNDINGLDKMIEKFGTER